MAQNPFQQQSVRRKFIYFGLILVLFTLSLGHRKFIINAQAENLRLRETDQGEVDLPGSTVQLMTTGFRGLVITSLWLTAIEQQRKHQWRGLEATVSSLTKLQPHFISPWLFQSWNLAFNVAVECDKPKDKYYFVTRGIELLAEGERRNKGNENPNPELRSPANPEMRFHIGFTYKLKIGTSDDQNVMQCLLDMSMMDPKDRNPETLWAQGAQGKKVDRGRFGSLCEKYPRFVRRLQDKLRISNATDVVHFLQENKDLPSRFVKLADLSETADLLPPPEQFPIVPPLGEDPSWPDPNARDFNRGDVDVFKLVRAWNSYAQIPLPPADPNPGPGLIKYDPLRYRLPRMSHIIFRSTPAQAQFTYAEHLQKEGWFHNEGWSIKKFFATESEEAGFDPDILVGKGKYDSAQAWKEAFDAFKAYGIANGLYISPEQREELEEKANAGGKKSPEAEKLKWNQNYRHMTNYDSFHYQTEVELLLPTVQARKQLFYARKQVINAPNARTLADYRQALYDWLDVLLQHAKFRGLDHLQEDTCELQVRYLYKYQDTNSNWLRPLLLNVARMSPLQPGGLLSPVAYARPALGAAIAGLAAVPANQGPWLALSAYVPGKSIYQYQLVQPTRLSSYADSLGVVPGANARGPFDVYVFAGEKKDRDRLTAGILVASELGLRLPGLPLPSLWSTRNDQQRRRILALPASSGEPTGAGWSRLIPQSITIQVRDRLGITRLQNQPKTRP